jgi:hypothetical protein
VFIFTFMKTCLNRKLNPGILQECFSSINAEESNSTFSTGSQTAGSPPPPQGRGWSSRGAGVLFMRDILKEISGQR